MRRVIMYSVLYVVKLGRWFHWILLWMILEGWLIMLSVSSIPLRRILSILLRTHPMYMHVLQCWSWFLIFGPMLQLLLVRLIIAWIMPIRTILDILMINILLFLVSSLHHLVVRVDSWMLITMLIQTWLTLVWILIMVWWVVLLWLVDLEGLQTVV